MQANDEEHWETLYRTRAPDQLSWFEADPATSLALLERAGLDRGSSVIDVGGGASALVDRLHARGVSDITVLDISAAALAVSRARLGDAASSVTWIAANVLAAPLDSAAYDIWHDRAVFHFLTAASDRARYIAQLTRALRPGGAVVMAAFAEDGPTRCSGLDVVRYGASRMATELGPEFELRQELRQSHRTPAGREQSFIYTRWARLAR